MDGRLKKILRMDLELIETGNGGDIIKNRKDVSVIFGFENSPYLSMFGGNVLQSTQPERLVSEQSYDFWGNNLLMFGDDSIQFNSLTERALLETPLNSAGRVLIEEAVKKDLQNMQDYCDVKVEVIIPIQDHLIIAIRLQKLGNIERRDFIYIWDATNQELIDRQNRKSNGGRVTTVRIFDDSFDLSFG